MIGQIGTATAATNFLNSLRDNTDIAPVVFVTTGRSPDIYNPSIRISANMG